MEFRIIDRYGHAWELYFADDDTTTGTLFYQGQRIGRYTERNAVAYIQAETGGAIESIRRVD